MNQGGEPISSLKTASVSPGKGIGARLVAYYGAFICLFFLLQLGVLWPGMGSFDTHVQWLQVMNGVMHNYHPPIMAWWWRILYLHVLHHGGVLFLFHSILFWIGLYVFGRELGKKSPLLACLLPAIWLTPTVMSMTAAIWKDTGMICCYILACALMFTHTIERRTMKLPVILATGLLLFYGTALRHNGILALPPLCLWLAVCILGHKARLRVLLAGAVCLFLIFALTIHLFNEAITDQKIDTSQQVVLVQLLAMSERVNHSVFPESYLAEKKLTYAQIRREHGFHYNYTEIRTLFTDTPETIAALDRALLQSIIDYPITYLTYRANAFKHLIRLGMKDSYYAYQWNPWNLSLAKRWCGAYLNAAKNTFWFKPWVWLVAAFGLFAAGAHALLKRRPGSVELTLLMISGLVYELGYFLVAPTTDFRYSYWLIITVLLGFLMFLHLRVPAPEKPQT